MRPTALLTFKISGGIVKNIEPSSLFRTAVQWPYKNGWPKGSSCYVSCQDDSKDPSVKQISFLATEVLVDHIKQKPQVKINLVTSYVFHKNALMKPNLDVQFESTL